MPRNYKNIKAWQIAKDLCLEIYRVTKGYPKEELYGVTSQTRRAATSVITNIAEGASRQHKRDYLNFLYNAKASLSELECLIDLANDLKYLAPGAFEPLDELCQKTASTLYGLIKAVEVEAVKA